MMSWLHASTMTEARTHASAEEIVACFRDQRSLFYKLAFLITTDEAIAEQAIDQACQITLQGSSPFRNWLLEWAKAATIAAAISLQGNAIHVCEAIYKNRSCPHAEHLSPIDEKRRAASLALILQMDSRRVIAELDLLCRAILVLRIAIRSSIQDCSLRLNVSRAAVLAANCHVMTWLAHYQAMPVDGDHGVSDALYKQ